MIALNAFHKSPLLAELKVSYQRLKMEAGAELGAPWLLTNSQTAEQYLRLIWDENRLELVEDFYLVCLNSVNEVLGWVRVACGGFDQTTVDVRLIFGIALQAVAASLVIAHNHPSGSVTPSCQDCAITANLRSAGDLLNIPVIDHIILGKDAAFSFADAGLL